MLARRLLPRPDSQSHSAPARPLQPAPTRWSPIPPARPACALWRRKPPALAAAPWMPSASVLAPRASPGTAPSASPTSAPCLPPECSSTGAARVRLQGRDWVGLVRALAECACARSERVGAPVAVDFTSLLPSTEPTPFPAAAACVTCDSTCETCQGPTGACTSCPSTAVLQADNTCKWCGTRCMLLGGCQRCHAPCSALRCGWPCQSMSQRCPPCPPLQPLWLHLERHLPHLRSQHGTCMRCQ